MDALFITPEKKFGFTLIEILVVLAIIGLLATGIFVSVGESSATGRDAKRQADLKNLQTAIESYKIDNGRYPEGCNGANQWAGQLGTDFECNSGVSPYDTYAGTGQYIMGLSPEYIAVLPIDPKLTSGRTDVGYVYRTNTDGSVYKIMAMNTVEADELISANSLVSYTHPLKSCHQEVRFNADGTYSSQPNNSFCHRVDFDNNSAWEPTEHCEFDDPRFQSSYGLWGGFANLNGTLIFPFQNNNNNRTPLKETVSVICQ